MDNTARIDCAHCTGHLFESRLRCRLSDAARALGFLTLAYRLDDPLRRNERVRCGLASQGPQLPPLPLDRLAASDDLFLCGIDCGSRFEDDDVPF